MAEGIKATIKFLVGNYALTFLVLGLLASLLAITRQQRAATAAIVVEKLLAWHLVFAIGALYLVNFIMHAFLGRLSAAVIGWADSPFQFEVATASLGFAAVGFYAAFRSFQARVAAIIGPALFMLGAAAGHVRQMIVAHNFEPGNAGIIFWMDIVIPLFGFALLIACARLGNRPVMAAVPSARLPLQGPSNGQT